MCGVRSRSARDELKFCAESPWTSRTGKRFFFAAHREQVKRLCSTLSPVWSARNRARWNLKAVGSIPAANLRRRELRNQKMGFVFQGYFLLPELTALENVLLPGMIGGKPKRSAAEKSLESVGLGDRLHHLPAELSGGEQQRVAIARALTNDPEIIFADEPTGNLDSKTGDTIIDLLLELARGRNKTLLVVTHDTRLAARGDRQLHIVDGLLE